MIRRISMWRLKDKADAEGMKEALMSMKGKVPSLLDIEVGINLSEHKSAFDIVFIGTFTSAEALAKFEKDDFHLSVGESVNQWREERVVVEYEC